MPNATKPSLMTTAEYLSRRNAYSYPAVGLDGTLKNYSEWTFKSDRALESHHRDLLRSVDDREVVLGYLSVIYWGHYSGKDGVARAARAMGKVRLAWNGADRVVKQKSQRMQGVKDLRVNHAAAIVREATKLVDSKKYGEALKELSALPQLNFAFASKICAFLLPERCGVVDSVIAKKWQRFGFQVDGKGFVRSNSHNATKYAAYCAFLRDEANILNKAGSKCEWRDFDGKTRPWRAVDVERAMY
jgi:hypothetical protein